MPVEAFISLRPSDSADGVKRRFDIVVLKRIGAYWSEREERAGVIVTLPESAHVRIAEASAEMSSRILAGEANPCVSFPFAERDGFDVLVRRSTVFVDPNKLPPPISAQLMQSVTHGRRPRLSTGHVISALSVRPL